MASTARKALPMAKGAVARLGACIAVTAVFAFLALVVGDGDYRATALGWVPLLSVIAAFAAAYGYSRVLRRSLRFRIQGDARDCPRGDAVGFAVRFENASPLFFFRIRARFALMDSEGDAAEATEAVLMLGPYESREVTFRASFDHLGTYSAGIEEVEAADFLGLFPFSLPGGRRFSVNVTPRMQTVASVAYASDATRENPRAARTAQADSLDYSHVREYEVGDPLKTIHWKLTARAGKSMTRLYEVHTEPGVDIVLDFGAPECSAAEKRELYDAVVESGLSLAHHARRQGLECTLSFYDGDGCIREVRAWSADDLPALVAAMPSMSHDGRRRAQAEDLVQRKIMDRAGQNNLVLCSSCVDGPLASLLIQAKAHRRAPRFIAAVPRRLEGRTRDDYCKPLAPLEASGIPCTVLSRSEELAGASL